MTTEEHFALCSFQLDGADDLNEELQESSSLRVGRSDDNPLA
jgi:hypothetical protein